jgi:hypothetical protein
MSNEEKESLKNAARDRKAMEITPFGRRRRRNSISEALRFYVNGLLGLLRSAAVNRVEPTVPVAVPVETRPRSRRGQ